ncbi:sigma-70 family RNA polymerase sigma factor [bacterium]|nr:sigma-70 family RNA polymerase sigma factor [bacterium]
MQVYMGGTGVIEDRPCIDEDRREQCSGKETTTVSSEDRLNEQALILRLREGDSRAIDELVELYKRPLFAFIVRMINNYELAEDIFQETWIKVIRSIKHFRGESKLSTWLFQIAVNQCRDTMRKDKRYVIVPIDEVENLVCDQTLDAERILKAEEVKKMVAGLPAKMREVIVLKYYHDLNDQEIADATGCPAGTVKSRLHRAAKILQKKWTFMNRK